MRAKDNVVFFPVQNKYNQVKLKDLSKTSGRYFVNLLK